MRQCLLLLKSSKKSILSLFRFSNCNRIIQIMDHQKILNILNEAGYSKFVNRKCNIINDQSNYNYSVRNEIIYSIELLKSNFCDSNDASVLVRDDTTIIDRNLTAEVAFKNCAPFIKCITK